MSDPRFVPLTTYQELAPPEMQQRVDAAIKAALRAAAEAEERDFYRRRAPQEWQEALRPLGTDEHKPYLASLFRASGRRVGPRAERCWTQHLHGTLCSKNVH